MFHRFSNEVQGNQGVFPGNDMVKENTAVQLFLSILHRWQQRSIRQQQWEQN